ncbi:FmdB family zinc ribbon protein [Desulfosediminicola flagellatus]|uniref:FmdB family zinc ribbon protein n=1 Tax=Desulfosediminicola flagellatus TaxID=2569541 RepID=UPI0010AD5666|nr:zinc ribbon domain-containing protein [Desulfosediminicola flagellatus]
MPIYEFYCKQCNIIFNFFSSRIDTTTSPDCPKCSEKNLPRQISRFATIRSGGKDSADDMAGLDEAAMERAFESLMRDADKVNEDDPRQMASLMRKFTAKAGLNLGDAMEEAISRMEAGEDPDQVEQEMGDLLDQDDLSLNALSKKVKSVSSEPVRDEKLYKL